jgi:hypothetical protein
MVRPLVSCVEANAGSGATNKNIMRAAREIIGIDVVACPDENPETPFMSNRLLHHPIGRGVKSFRASNPPLCADLFI